KDRKDATRCVPVLIEMKYGSSAFDGSAGILKHIKDLNEFLSDLAKKSGSSLFCVGRIHNRWFGGLRCRRIA
ncbi:MAG TPA: hypothetical protein VGI45_07135, partial [Terracidiphilus sp.]